jgi:bifunctional non-homologous end joining protein LigD
VNAASFQRRDIVSAWRAEAPITATVEVACALHRLLDQRDIPHYCKTSGKRGLHVYIPLGAQYDYDLARQFAEFLAILIHRQTPGVSSILRAPNQRVGKVYLDYLQNRRGQTVAAPYSVRPVVGAPVSTPLKWSEVNKRLDPSRFTIKTAPKRFDKLGDLWQPILGPGVDLAACLARLSDK